MPTYKEVYEHEHNKKRERDEVHKVMDARISKAKSKALSKAKEMSKADQKRYSDWKARGRDIRKTDPKVKLGSWKEATSEKGWRKGMDF